MQTVQSFVYYSIVFPPFCQKAVFSVQSFYLRSARRQWNKQTKWIVRLNDSTFPYKRIQNVSSSELCVVCAGRALLPVSCSSPSCAVLCCDVMWCAVLCRLRQHVECLLRLLDEVSLLVWGMGMCKGGCLHMECVQRGRWDRQECHDWLFVTLWYTFIRVSRTSQLWRGRWQRFLVSPTTSTQSWAMHTVSIRTCWVSISARDTSSVKVTTVNFQLESITLHLFHLLQNLCLNYQSLVT